MLKMFSIFLFPFFSPLSSFSSHVPLSSQFCLVIAFMFMFWWATQPHGWALLLVLWQKFITLVNVWHWPPSIAGNWWKAVWDVRIAGHYHTFCCWSFQNMCDFCFCSNCTCFFPSVLQGWVSSSHICWNLSILFKLTLNHRFKEVLSNIYLLSEISEVTHGELCVQKVGCYTFLCSLWYFLLYSVCDT